MGDGVDKRVVGEVQPRRAQVAVIVHVQDDDLLDRASRHSGRPLAPAEQGPLVVKRSHDAAFAPTRRPHRPQGDASPPPAQPDVQCGVDMPIGPIRPSQIDGDIASGLRDYRVFVTEVVAQEAVPLGRVWGEAAPQHAHALLQGRGFQNRCQGTAGGRQRASGQGRERFAQAGIGVQQLILGPGV